MMVNVLASTLISIFLSAMLEEAFRDMGDGVYIKSRQDADLFTVDKRQKHNMFVRELPLALLTAH